MFLNLFFDWMSAHDNNLIENTPLTYPIHLDFYTV